jgi:hypothetical protein
MPVATTQSLFAISDKLPPSDLERGTADKPLAASYQVAILILLASRLPCGCKQNVVLMGVPLNGALRGALKIFLFVFGSVSF